MVYIDGVKYACEVCSFTFPHSHSPITNVSFSVASEATE